MKFDHIGIPVTGKFEGEIDLPHLRMTVSDHKNNPYGIQWQRYWDNSPYPEIVKTIAHVAFVVDDLDSELNRVFLSNSTRERAIRYLRGNCWIKGVRQVDSSWATDSYSSISSSFTQVGGSSRGRFER